MYVRIRGSNLSILKLEAFGKYCCPQWVHLTSDSYVGHFTLATTSLVTPFQLRGHRSGHCTFFR